MPSCVTPLILSMMSCGSQVAHSATGSPHPGVKLSASDAPLYLLPSDCTTAVRLRSIYTLTYTHIYTHTSPHYTLHTRTNMYIWCTYSTCICIYVRYKYCIICIFVQSTSAALYISLNTTQYYIILHYIFFTFTYFYFILFIYFILFHSVQYIL